MFLRRLAKSLFEQDLKYSRRLLVQPDAYSIQFSLQQCSLLCTFRSIQHHQNEITRLTQISSERNTASRNGGKTNLSSRNDLSSTSLTLRRTLNDTRQIKNLNLRTSILKHTRNSSERSERIRGRLTLRLGDLAQEGRFTDGGETDESYTRITTLAHIETDTTTTGATCGLQELGS